MAVLARLAAGIGFTETESRLASFILSHADEVTGMSIDVLAKESFTSSATVVRLCKKVGTQGYRDMLVQLATDLEHDRMSQNMVDANAPFLEGEGVPAIIGNVAALYRRAVDECSQVISNSAVYGAARTLSKADRFFYLAMGESAYITDCFACELAKIGILGVSIERRGDWSTVASLIGPSDVVLVVTYSGYLLQDASMHATQLQRYGCKTILVTANADAAAQTSGFDHRIVIAGSERHLEGVSSFYSQTAIRYALDCLYGAVFSFSYRQSEQRREQVSRQIQGDVSGVGQ